jgi:hypothetical protein
MDPLLDPDPYLDCGCGSRSKEIDKFTNKPDFQHSEKAFVPQRYIRYLCFLTFHLHKGYSSLKIQLLVMKKTDQVPGPHGSALVLLPESESALKYKVESRSAIEPMPIYNTNLRQ